MFFFNLFLPLFAFNSFWVYYFKLQYIHIHVYVFYLLFNVYLTYSAYYIKNA